jgi:hypothetical protein
LSLRENLESEGLFGHEKPERFNSFVRRLLGNLEHDRRFLPYRRLVLGGQGWRMGGSDPWRLRVPDGVPSQARDTGS